MDKKVYCGAMLLASIVSTGCAEQKKVEEQKPNIIYFLVDDMGMGDLSLTGQKKYETPNIDNWRQTVCCLPIIIVEQPCRVRHVHA